MPNLKRNGQPTTCWWDENGNRIPRPKATRVLGAARPLPKCTPLKSFPCGRACLPLYRKDGERTKCKDDPGANVGPPRPASEVLPNNRVPSARYMDVAARATALINQLPTNPRNRRVASARLQLEQIRYRAVQAGIVAMPRRAARAAIVPDDIASFCGTGEPGAGVQFGVI